MKSLQRMALGIFLGVSLLFSATSSVDAGYSLPTRYVEGTAQNKTFALFATSSPVGDFLILAENVNGEWLGRYTTVPRFGENALENYVKSTHGGNVNAWIASEAPKINARLNELLTAPDAQPPPVSGNYLDAVNNVLVQEWTFVVNSSGKLELKRK